MGVELELSWPHDLGDDARGLTEHEALAVSQVHSHLTGTFANVLHTESEGVRVPIDKRD